MTTKRARARAPQHRLDHIPKYIPLGDPAWDEKLVAKALEDADAKVEIDGEDVELLPLRRYIQGRTRYDLDEPSLREVIAKTKCLDMEAAEIWSLRVLPFDERLRVQQLSETDEAMAHLVAFGHGVVGLQTPETDDGARELVKLLEKLPTKGRKAGQVAELYESVANYRMEALADVGLAAKILSMDLFEEERRS